MSSEPFGQEPRQENSLADSAFEPQQNFMFDEGASDDEFQNMQREFSTFSGIKDAEMQ